MVPPGDLAPLAGELSNEMKGWPADGVDGSLATAWPFRAFLRWPPLQSDVKSPATSAGLHQLRACLVMAKPEVSWKSSDFEEGDVLRLSDPADKAAFANMEFEPLL